MGSKGRMGILVLCAAALALVIASTANASIHTAGGYKYVTKSFNVKKSSRTHLTVNCPSGTHVYGGGQSNNGVFGQLQQQQSYPKDTGDHNRIPDDAWSVLVRNKTSHSLSSVVYAICGHKGATYRTKKLSPADVADDNEKDLTCKDGTGDLIGGGFSGPRSAYMASGGPSAYLSGDFFLYVSDPGASSKGSVQYAICAHITTTYVENLGSQALPSAETEDVASCPAGTYVLSGGDKDAGGVLLNTSAPDPGGASWTIYVDNSGATNRLFKAVAACGAGI